MYDTHEFIVARVSVNLTDWQTLNLINFTTVPSGLGYGIKIMELLSLLRVNAMKDGNPDYRRQIEAFRAAYGSEKSYRNQFRLSVTE